MPLQKRKHRKYRKKEPDAVKELKKSVIRARESKKIIENLYLLPLDVKEIICQIALMSHMSEWSKRHSISLKIPLDFISFKCTNNSLHSSWVGTFHDLESFEQHWDNYKDNSKYRKRAICSINVETKSQSGITSIHIPVNMCPQILHREWTNLDNQYWYHEKCRCITCDRVRFVGRDYLNPKEKERYSNMEWEHLDNQWKTKSKLQLKYERNVDRVRQVKQDKLRLLEDQLSILRSLRSLRPHGASSR